MSVQKKNERVDAADAEIRSLKGFWKNCF